MTTKIKTLTPSSDILTFFPAPSFRDGQQEAIELIDRAFKEGFKFVFLEAPTGIGKTYIAMTFALQNMANGLKTHIITPQKILQNQYGKDFPIKAHLVKGRGAYQCTYNVPNCDYGPCQRIKDFVPCKGCLYRNALKIAQKHPIVIHNFDSFYFQTLARRHEDRNLIILDEAHNTEGKFKNFVEFSLYDNPEENFYLPEFKTTSEYDNLVEEKLENICLLLKTYENSPELTEEELKSYKALKKLHYKLISYQTERTETPFVFEFTKLKNKNRVTFKPVFGGNLVKNFLYQKAERFLFMSATFLGKEITCRNLKIPPSEAAYISLPSYFPATNRPIKRFYAGNMGWKTKQQTLPKVVEKIREILILHPNERGIIHTSSTQTAKYIEKQLSEFPRLKYNHNFPNVDKLLAEHEKTPGSVIVAAGLKEGLDLKNNLSRFQIIVKVPYPSLKDKQVKARMQIDPEWYGYVTTLLWIQSLGRSVRSKDDFAVTYLLDEGFERFFKRNWKFVPEYIREALKVK